MEKQYKYQLRKSSRKEVCPQCGQRRFVPYVLTEDNATIVGETFGRCDRENSCGYWHKPDGNEVVSDVKPQPVNLDMMTVDPRIIDDFGSLRYRLAFNTLYKYGSWLVGTHDVDVAYDAYKVISKDGCGFLQIDINGVIRGGKFIKFKNGHRVKDEQPVRWLHKTLPSYVRGDVLKQCFFGEHLLADSSKPVAIVESEKTALLMSRIMKEYTWLACGGSQNLKNEDKLKVLEGRQVTLFPDNGQYAEWTIIANRHGWMVDNSCAGYKEGMKDGYDILDLYENAKYDAEEEERRRMMEA